MRPTNLFAVAPSDEAATGPRGCEISFGRYQLRRSIGRGGMAEVWEAEWRPPHGQAQMVALKRVLPILCADREVVRMFVAEGQLATRLRHPGIVRSLEVGEVEGRAYLAMELLRGIDLRTLFKRLHGPPPVAFAVWVAAQLADALAYVHGWADAGRPLRLVHRDVSPSNVMLGVDGSVKLLDFGIAKLHGDLRGDLGDVTRTGIIKGKSGYLAPELLAGKPYDHRVDVFSLGVVLYELLTHQRLFGGTDRRDMMQANRACRVSRPSAINRSVSAQLDAVMLRALARRPEDRYASAEELAAALSEALVELGVQSQEGHSLVRVIVGGAAPEVHEITRELAGALVAGVTSEADDPDNVPTIEPLHDAEVATVFGRGPAVDGSSLGAAESEGPGEDLPRPRQNPWLPALARRWAVMGVPALLAMWLGYRLVETRDDASEVTVTAPPAEAIRPAQAPLPAPRLSGLLAPSALGTPTDPTVLPAWPELKITDPPEPEAGPVRTAAVPRPAPPPRPPRRRTPPRLDLEDRHLFDPTQGRSP